MTPNHYNTNLKVNFIDLYRRFQRRLVTYIEDSAPFSNADVCSKDACFEPWYIHSVLMYVMFCWSECSCFRLIKCTVL